MSKNTTKKAGSDLSKLFAPPMVVELSEDISIVFNTISSSELARVKGPMSIMELIEAMDNLDMNILSALYAAGAKKSSPEYNKEFFDSLSWHTVVSKLKGVAEYVTTLDCIIKDAVSASSPAAEDVEDPNEQTETPA